MSRWWRAGLLLALFCATASVARAHNPDTSYARILIRPDHLELRFTLDVFTLQKITVLDVDGDQRVTPAEQQRAAPAIQKFLREHVHLELDAEATPLGEASPPDWPRDAGEALAAADWHNANSLMIFVFRQSYAHPPREVAVQFDYFEPFGTRHTVLGAFEYGGRSEEVTFTETEPDYLFDTEWSDAAQPAAAATPTATARPSTGPALLRFFRLGIEHIFFGYDHICFLIALIVVGRLRDLVKIVTSFTVAHSITLILAALQIATLPARFVECAIAGTIVYVAAENLIRRSVAHRWVLTFCFGLIHGFGFANTLIALGLPTIGRIRCLLVFNGGVEVAQLAIILLAFPFVRLLSQSRHAAAGRAFVSIAVGLFGLVWLTERALNLRLMPL